MVLTILGVELRGIAYTHSVVKLSPLSSRTFSSSQMQTIYSLNSNFPVPGSPYHTLSLYEFVYSREQTEVRWRERLTGKSL